MNNVLTRRRLLEVLGVGSLGAVAGWAPGAVAGPGPGEYPAGLFKIRTITAGVPLRSAADLGGIDGALGFLAEARAACVDGGYEVQTVRIATQPLADYLPDWTSPASIAVLTTLDRHATAGGAGLCVGPVMTRDEAAPAFAPWAADLVLAASNTSFTAFVASASAGVHYHAARSAAEAISAIAGATPGGEGNFQFAATAMCPPGTPFFPAAYHAGTPAFSIGLESPNLLQAVFAAASDVGDAKARLSAQMNVALQAIERIGLALAQRSGWRYLGIDTSPAPGLDASIGGAIETLAGAPFGSPSTLAACAAITDVLKGLEVKSCGYSGLMLPVLEDTVLARRAAEGRFGVADLLLYSSVCGTGLDVVPLPGDVAVDQLAAVIIDTAALAAKYAKPLSARLFPVPGKGVGDIVRFDNPYLTEAVVMAVDS